MSEPNKTDECRSKLLSNESGLPTISVHAESKEKNKVQLLIDKWRVILILNVWKKHEASKLVTLFLYNPMMKTMHFQP